MTKKGKQDNTGGRTLCQEEGSGKQAFPSLRNEERKIRGRSTDSRRRRPAEKTCQETCKDLRKSSERPAEIFSILRGIVRDFEKDIASASQFRKVLPETEFSWSLSRHRLFHFCKRACFLHYYLAQGGWDEYADPLVREVYSLKKLLPLHLHLSGIFEDSLSEALLRTRGISGPPVEKKKLLLGLLLRSLSRKASRAFPLRPCFSPDGGGTTDGRNAQSHWNLLEHFYGVRGFSTAEAVHNRITKELGAAWRAFGESALADEISSLAGNDFVFCARIADLRYGSCRIWIHPGTVWFRENKAFALRFDFSGGSPFPQDLHSGGSSSEAAAGRMGKATPPGRKEDQLEPVRHRADEDAEREKEAGEDAALFALYARERWKSSAAVSFRILRFFREGNASEIKEVRPCTGIGELIRTSVEDMLRPLREDGKFDIADFPPPEKEKLVLRCSVCRFRNVCRSIRDAAGEES